MSKSVILGESRPHLRLHEAPVPQEEACPAWGGERADSRWGPRL